MGDAATTFEAEAVEVPAMTARGEARAMKVGMETWNIVVQVTCVTADEMAPAEAPPSRDPMQRKVVDGDLDRLGRGAAR